MAAVGIDRAEQLLAQRLRGRTSQLPGARVQQQIDERVPFHAGEDEAAGEQRQLPFFPPDEDRTSLEQDGARLVGPRKEDGSDRVVSDALSRLILGREV